jgi:hypothetical protein
MNEPLNSWHENKGKYYLTGGKNDSIKSDHPVIKLYRMILGLKDFIGFFFKKDKPHEQIRR